MAADQSTTACLVDAHVHIYDCFDIEILLDAAVRNFSAVASKHGLEDWFAVLMLTETAEDHAFQELVKAAEEARDRPADSRWQFKATGEAESVVAHRDDGASLVVIAGRQVVTRGKLEVLALGTLETFDDGLEPDEALARVLNSNALAVLPWGVGKWWGSRGELIDVMLERTEKTKLLLGDNSGRPWLFPQPAQFVRAAAERRRILPGSDPLPFAREAVRVGSVGNIVAAEVSETAPAASLKQILRDPANQVTGYMQLEGPVRFLRNQIGMQLRAR